MSQTQVPALSFPYPTEKISPPRPAGQGCLACVHKRYCGAYYWHIRFIEREMPAQYGLSCAKWSGNPEDIIRTKTAGDFYQIYKMSIDGIAMEANQNGCDDYSI